MISDVAMIQIWIPDLFWFLLLGTFHTVRPSSCFVLTSTSSSSIQLNFVYVLDLNFKIIKTYCENALSDISTSRSRKKRDVKNSIAIPEKNFRTPILIISRLS